MIELVYLKPLQSIDTSGKSIIYRYQKLNGNTDIHIRSADKEKFHHCYDSLVEGSSYVIICENKGKRRGRWIWTYAIRLPEKWALTFCDKINTYDGKAPVPGYTVTNMDVVFKVAAEIKELIVQDKKPIAQPYLRHVQDIIQWN